MKNWSRAENYVFNDMLRKSEQLITELVQDEEDFKDIVTVERIANILIVRLRKFLKVMTADEVYNYAERNAVAEKDESAAET